MKATRPERPAFEPADRALLARLGWILIGLGAADVGLMAWALATGRDYGGSLNVLALVGGYLLLRGSVAAARGVALLADATGAGALALVGGMACVYPWPLFLLQLRQEPWGYGASLLAGLAVAAYLLWMAGTLTRALRRASADAGRPRRRLGWAIGVGLAAVMVAGVAAMNHGDSADLVRQHALLQAGQGYQHAYVSRYSVRAQAGSSRHEATAIVYGDKGWEEVFVEWGD